ncbi:MAG: hypothetical protein V3U87_12595 [Methylococcaceae bacterium]
MYFIANYLTIALVVFSVQSIADTPRVDTATSTDTTITEHGGKAILTTNKVEYTFKVPKDSIVKHSFVTRDFVGVINANQVPLLVVDEENKLAYDPELYKLPTKRDILLAIYDKNITNNSQVNEWRKSIKEFGGHNLKIYNRGEVIFFRYDLNENEKIKTLVTVSSPIEDEVLRVDFYKASNEVIVMDFINSFSLKRKK